MAIIYKNVAVPKGASVVVVNTSTNIVWNNVIATAIPSYNVGTSYSFISNTTVTNPVGATTYSLASGSLPAGTSLNTSTGVVSGTLSTVSYYNFTLRATNNGKTSDKNIQINVTSTATTVTWLGQAAGVTLPTNNTGPGAINFSYDLKQILEIRNPVGSTTYSYASGSMPYCTLNANTGIISGVIPRYAGFNSTFYVRATNHGVSADKKFSIIITSR